MLNYDRPVSTFTCLLTVHFLFSTLKPILRFALTLFFASLRAWSFSPNVCPFTAKQMLSVSSKPLSAITRRAAWKSPPGKAQAYARHTKLARCLLQDMWRIDSNELMLALGNCDDVEGARDSFQRVFLAFLQGESRNVLI